MKKRHYIVTSESIPMLLGHYDDTPRGGVLVKGDSVTCFNNYSRAWRAVQRTKNYAKRNKLPWKTYSLKILPLKEV